MRRPSRALLAGLPEAGADLIEIGVPFSDPMADGPAIQAAGLRALEGRHDAEQACSTSSADSARGDDATPIVLMGYYNPIHRYGVERFLADAKSAGVDGLIVVDLPPEHDDELCLPAQRAGLDFIRLATPTTDDRRLPKVLTQRRGLPLLRRDRRHHRHQIGVGRCRGRGGDAAEAPHRAAGRGRLRHPHAGAGGRGRARRRCGGGRLGPGRKTWRAPSTRTARRSPNWSARCSPMCAP